MTSAPAGTKRGCTNCGPRTSAAGCPSIRAPSRSSPTSKPGGTRLALLSNAGPDFGSYFRHGPLGDFFAACYVSGELNLLKPHPEIYQHVLNDLGITSAEAVFIDNRAANVRGAEALGITSHLFTDVTALRAFLTSLG